jgi:hypothetical protein
MENETDPRSLRGLWQWATTPPQSYPMYVIALILVLGASYYAGTLKPRKQPPAGMAAPTVSVPRN